MCKAFVSRNIHRYKRKSQMSLFQGKEDTSGNTYCYSDKHKRHRIKVNAHPKVYESQLLGRQLRIYTSTNAMRTIRKYGGFDNYILLMPERRMKSIYGEYLRELMLRKLADPEFQVNEVLKEPRFEVELKRKGKRIHRFRRILNKHIWIPPEMRHQDLSHLFEPPEAEIPLRDRKKYEELKYKIFNKEDINFDDDFVKRIKAEYENEPEPGPEFLEEIASAKNRIFKTRALRKKYEDHMKEAKSFQAQFPIDIY